MKRFRPKLLFVFATFFTSMAVTLIGLFAFLDTFYPNMSLPDQLSWIPIAVATVPSIMRAVGIVPVLHSLMSEVFPTEIRLILSHCRFLTFNQKSSKWSKYFFDDIIYFRNIYK